MKYKIKREFFPFSCFRPPISKNFLKVAVPYMKPPKAIFKDKTVDNTDIAKFLIKAIKGE